MTTVRMPPIADIRARLIVLTVVTMEDLAAKSGVPYTTLMKIRSGETQNPGIETVRKFLGHIPKPIVGNARRMPKAGTEQEAA